MAFRRLVRSEDFVRVLAAAPCARSAHFALHFAEGQCSAARQVSPKRLTTELSTAPEPSVDESVERVPGNAPGASAEPPPAWLGAVVPKRHARRAVTRSLVKRQIRAAAERVAVGGGTDESRLFGGVWIVRLRSPIRRDAFPSASSQALRVMLRGELDALFAAAVARRRAAAPRPR